MTQPTPTLLVIDDEPHMRRLLQFTLGKFGAKLLFAGSGDEGLRLAGNNTVDLVIVDFVMPGMDGFATLKQLRQDPRHAKVPAIMLTSRGQTELKETAEDVGVDLFLTKPFSPLELTREVQRLLGGQGK